MRKKHLQPQNSEQSENLFETVVQSPSLNCIKSHLDKHLNDLCEEQWPMHYTMVQLFIDWSTQQAQPLTLRNIGIQNH